VSKTKSAAAARNGLAMKLFLLGLTALAIIIAAETVNNGAKAAESISIQGNKLTSTRVDLPWETAVHGYVRIVVAKSTQVAVPAYVAYQSAGAYILYITHFADHSAFPNSIDTATVSLISPCNQIGCPVEGWVNGDTLIPVPPDASEAARTAVTLHPAVLFETNASHPSFHWRLQITKSEQSPFQFSMRIYNAHGATLDTNLPFGGRIKAEVTNGDIHYVRVTYFRSPNPLLAGLGGPAHVYLTSRFSDLANAEAAHATHLELTDASSGKFEYVFGTESVPSGEGRAYEQPVGAEDESLLKMAGPEMFNLVITIDAPASSVVATPVAMLQDANAPTPGVDPAVAKLKPDNNLTVLSLSDTSVGQNKGANPDVARVEDLITHKNALTPSPNIRLKDCLLYLGHSAGRGGDWYAFDQVIDLRHVRVSAAQAVSADHSIGNYVNIRANEYRSILTHEQNVDFDKYQYVAETSDGLGMVDRASTVSLAAAINRMAASCS